MKKQLASLSAFALSIALGTTANAAVELTPSASTVNIDDSFTVNVQATALSNIDSASVKFAYDQAVVRLDGITLGGGAAFCDLVVRDAIPNDGQVEGIFALAHTPIGDSCLAITGDFIAFQIQMTAIAEGNASLALTQDSTGFGWTSEDNPGVIIAAASTTATPIQIVVASPVGIDTDNDGVFDSADNCTEVANADQRDTDSDNYGNMCDGDLNNDGRANTIDLNIYKAAHRTSLGQPNYNPDADFNGDDRINTIDLNIYKLMHRGVPGPSGLAP